MTLKINFSPILCNHVSFRFFFRRKCLEVSSCHPPVAVVRTINSHGRRHLQGFHVPMLCLRALTCHSAPAEDWLRSRVRDNSFYLCGIHTPGTGPAAQMRCNPDNQSVGSHLQNKTGETLPPLLSAFRLLSVDLKIIIMKKLKSAHQQSPETLQRHESNGCAGNICEATLHINSHVLQGHGGQFGIHDFASRSHWEIGCIMGNATNSSTSAACAKQARSQSKVAHFMSEHARGKKNDAGHQLRFKISREF